MRTIPGHGYIVAGHDVSRAAALAQVRARLIQGGMSEFDAEGMTDNPRLVVQAWWIDEYGFVQEHHEGAEPVTVVNIPPPEGSP